MKILNNNFFVSILKFYVLLFLFFPFLTFAQGTLFISPPAGTYKQGESFSILVNVNTGGQPINAASAQIGFDNQRLEVTSVGYSSSIFKILVLLSKY